MWGRSKYLLCAFSAIRRNTEEIKSTLNGGDIDLFIETEKYSSLQDKISFISILKWELGDQKIDVVVHSPNRKDKKIYCIAKENGIEI
jgi:hypothetical protein